MRKIAKIAASAAMGGALLLGFTGTASADTGPTNLTGMGCPSSYTNYNSATGGTSGWSQRLTRTFVAPNSLLYGVYDIYSWTSAGSTFQGTTEYRC
ncbi:hypothetical protein ACFRAR_20035 [Kitasatospora sp. NPDC056651]|uniref:hypothetical protein n=1 Tax=Kitasatospora sp. NPDC056651 TaxID=3345892 RepID=UPI0036ACCCAB